MGFHPRPHQAVPEIWNREDNEQYSRVGEEALQDYCQQALLSDGLQRIDEWTYVVQDWNEGLGFLEVSLCHLPSTDTKN